MYHRIGPASDGHRSLWIDVEAFRRQLAWLAEAGYRTLSLDQAYDVLRARTVPRRTVLLTFDDAFAETLQRVAPLLGAAGLHAAVFVPAGLLGREVELRHPDTGAAAATTGRIATVEELREWSEQGLDVGSHSLSHTDLTRCDADEARRQAAESRWRLEEVLSRSVRDFCYPFAHHDPAARRAVAAAGYRAAYAGEPPTDDLLAIPRMMVYPGDTDRRFRRKLSGYYYWLSAWHRRLLTIRTRPRPTRS
jgi:peptidoglycan/xylan/chitin deacetylase (PgdA/CDA1 family)